MGVDEKKQEGKVKKESSKAEGFGSSNYPNPFNPATTISFSIPKDGMTELKIYNMLGENIETLVSQPLSAGTYSYSWNAARYSSGIYFYVLRSGNNVQTKRMMLVK
ncbi:MAG TPA: T9SS type A sorting domain-containing protein [Clostridia bacterium]|nr:T9SS type A sorting domain-containing protein [Clostridia bacterium]